MIMVNPKKSRKKNGIQVCILFPLAIYDDITKIMHIENKWIKEDDFIRKAVNEKIERWKKELPSHP